MTGTKAKILARRARFVGATLAAAGLGAASHGCAGAQPQPCLSVVPADPPQDGGAPPTHEEDASPPPSDAEPPRVCLTFDDYGAEPEVCLRALPDDDVGD